MKLQCLMTTKGTVSWFHVMFRKAAEAEMQLSHTVEFPLPWTRESPMTNYLLTDGGPNGRQRFHRPDCWHNFHLGVGKAFVAGSVHLLQWLEWESSIDKRMAAMGQDYKDFCKRRRLTSFLKKVDKFTFGGTGDSAGAWNKGSITTNFMLWLDDYCERHAADIHAAEDERLLFIVPRMSFTACGFLAFPSR